MADRLALLPLADALGIELFERGQSADVALTASMPPVETGDDEPMIWCGM